ncbi:MAG: hypothetical protein LBV43_10650 [Prevotella sp.]|jgi:hypothetical protein|nr:hypothetical protein [Prevotella sp.]
MIYNTIQKRLILIVLLFVVSLGGYHALAQQGGVTVGSPNPPAKAALLEIKSEETANPVSTTDATNITSKIGGLGLPRVYLENKKTLEPFIVKTADWDDTTPSQTTLDIKRKHAGMMVYNIYVSKDDTNNPGTDPDTRLKQGVYVWDGAKWTMVGEGVGQRYFYIPSFNIPIEEITPSGDPDLTLDLYQEYASQFTKAGNTTFFSNNNTLARVPSPDESALYKTDELDYVITYFDESVISVTGIDDYGVMSYRVISLKTTPDSFLNVVFVVKD